MLALTLGSLEIGTASRPASAMVAATLRAAMTR